MVELKVEASNYGGLVCVYNILTRIYQRIKGEETISEVTKHKRDLEILNMLEDEAITIYTF